MAHILADMVKQTSTSAGATALALTGAAQSPYRSFSSVLAEGDTTEAMVLSRGSGAWQAAVYEYAGGALTFRELLSSSTGAQIAFTPGLKDVYIAPLAGRPQPQALDVRSFRVSMDGTTNDTARVISAVAMAAFMKRELFWPDGTALTTATIPLLHTVKHVGPGAIQRGSNVFYFRPQREDVNDFFTSPAGDEDNDGLSESEPMTPQAASDAWENYGPVLEGTWQLNFAAGDHSNISMAMGVKGVFRLIGVPTGDFVSRPTSRITKAMSGLQRQGIYVKGSGQIVYVKDIEAFGFNNDATAESGMRAEYFAEIYYENAWSYDSFRGRFHEVFVIHSSKGGRVKTAYWGTSDLFFCTRNYQYAGSIANGTIIEDCASTGEHNKEFITGHNDYLKVRDCKQGFLFSRCATANMSNTDLKRNEVGIVVGPGCSVINNLSMRWNGQPTTGASWAAGVVTFNFVLDDFGRGVNVAAGETFEMTRGANANYNGTFVAQTASDTRLTAAMASDPGTWVSGGLCNFNDIQILTWNPNILLQDGPGGNLEDIVATPYVGMTEKIKAQLLVPVTVQTTTALTILWFPTPGFKPGELQAEGYHARIEASGVYTFGSAATFNFRGNTNNMEVFNLASGTHNWQFEGKVVVTATGNFQYHRGVLLVDGQTVQAANGTKTYDMAAVEFIFGLWCQPSSAAGGNTMTINQATLYTTCM